MKELKLVLILAVIVLVSITTFRIAYYDEYLSVIKNYSEVQRLKEAETDKILRVYKADDEIIQIATIKGYQDYIEMSVAIKDDKVVRVEILSHNETADYGGYITEDWFLKRLNLAIADRLKIVKISKKNSNEVVAITGATISSQSVVNGVNVCIDNYKEVVK